MAISTNSLCIKHFTTEYGISNIDPSVESRVYLHRTLPTWPFKDLRQGLDLGLFQLELVLVLFRSFSLGGCWGWGAGFTRITKRDQFTDLQVAFSQSKSLMIRAKS